MLATLPNPTTTDGTCPSPIMIASRARSVRAETVTPNHIDYPSTDGRIIRIFPVQSGRPELSWGAICTMRECRWERYSFLTRWHSRRSAADHLWSHRGGRPSTPSAPSIPCPTPTKRRHPTAAEARAHIASLFRNGRGNPDYRAYKCVCGDYHVGHCRKNLRGRIQHALKIR